MTTGRTVAVVAVPNRHDAGVTDTAINVWYPGLIFSMWRSGVTERELLEIVTLTDSSIRLPGTMGVSRTSPAELRTVLGEPNGRSQVADTLVLGYLSPASEADEWLYFHFVAQPLRLARWNFSRGGTSL